MEHWAFEGLEVGEAEGVILGLDDGCDVGVKLGDAEGTVLGVVVGAGVGTGNADGKLTGADEGGPVGLLCWTKPSVDLAVGEEVGLFVGLEVVPCWIIPVGDLVGAPEHKTPSGVISPFSVLPLPLLPLPPLDELL